MLMQLGPSILRCIGAVILSVLLFLAPAPCWAADDLTVATWNAALLNRSVNDLALRDFAEAVDFDILILNEIQTQTDLDQIKANLNRDHFSTAISSFSNGSGNLEVGILSRFPLTEVVEFDQSQIIREMPLQKSSSTDLRYRELPMSMWAVAFWWRRYRTTML